MTIDKYTKFILTLIAVGVIGINLHYYKGSFVKEAKAATELIDLMIMKDEIIQRIALSEIRLQEQIKSLVNFNNRNFGFNLSLAVEENNISNDRIYEIAEEAVKSAFNY